MPSSSIVTDKENGKITALPLSTRTKSSCKKRSSRKRISGRSPSFVETVPTKVEMDTLHPFWFEAPRTTIIDKQMVHAGITRKELLQLKALLSRGAITEEFLNTVLVPLNDEKSDLPRLRAFNWAVTNYAKGFPTMTVKPQEYGGTVVDLSVSYNQHLKKLHRSLFDPYRRGTFLYFNGIATAGDSSDSSLNPPSSSIHYTTVGQLTFVAWCVENGVDKYVAKNESAIRDHMNDALRGRRKEMKNSHAVTTPDTLATKRTRTRELTYAPSKYFRGAVAGNMMTLYTSLSKEK